jgi:predicted short-subunit dehydrogenase-like oxidoreductase (DUF2520 family)
MKTMSVFVLGAGKLGSALSRALRKAGVKVTLRPARRGLPRSIDADVVVLAVRDRELQPTAAALVGVVARRAVVVHVAGALDATPLSPLRGACAGVAQMHPMISFAGARIGPELARGNVHVQGDPVAVARARRLAKRLGMTPRTVKGLDTVAYHAAAGLVANGAAALAAVGAELLVKAGVSRADAAKMLGPLVRSVADNIETLGFPGALTGPVRRGDATGVEKHLATLRARLPDAVGLYIAAAYAQLPLARALGDAPAASFDEVAAVLARTAPAAASAEPARPPRRGAPR